MIGRPEEPAVRLAPTTTAVCVVAVEAVPGSMAATCDQAVYS